MEGVFVANDCNVMTREGLFTIPTWLNDDKGSCTWMQMSSNESKLMSKTQFFCNSCYICLCGATLMACESWKVMFIETYGY